MAEQRSKGNKSNPIYDFGGRVLPQDKELEEAVLGALMLEKDAYSNVCDMLKPDCFYTPVNRKIFEAIQMLGASNQPIDMLTVTEQLRHNGELDNVGGPVFVSELTSRVASGAHVEYHARIVAQKYLARELITFAAEIEKKAFDEANDVDDLMQEAEGKLFEISQRNVKKDVTQIDPVIGQAIEQMQVAANRTTGLSGLETGFHELDKLTSGWQNSDLTQMQHGKGFGRELQYTGSVVFARNVEPTAGEPSGEQRLRDSGREDQKRSAVGSGMGPVHGQGKESLRGASVRRRYAFTLHLRTSYQGAPSR